jgi:hypothetical protein
LHFIRQYPEPSVSCPIAVQMLAFTVETLYFYPANPEKPNTTVAVTLREALSKVLVHYDFLAGRVKLNEIEMRMEINRNNAGAQFSSASCDLTLQELGDVTAPNPMFRYTIAHDLPDHMLKSNRFSWRT